MPQELTKQIEYHLATFPERHEDMLEMKKEWGEMKSKAMWVLLGFVGSILAIGVWVGTMQTNIENITQDHEDADEWSQQVERRLGTLEVTNGEIKARLTSIDLALQEIKVAIKNIPR